MPVHCNRFTFNLVMLGAGCLDCISFNCVMPHPCAPSGPDHAKSHLFYPRSPNVWNPSPQCSTPCYRPCISSPIHAAHQSSSRMQGGQGPIAMPRTHLVKGPSDFAVTHCMHKHNPSPCCGLCPESEAVGTMGQAGCICTGSHLHLSKNESSKTGKACPECQRDWEQWSRHHVQTQAPASWRCNTQKHNCTTPPSAHASIEFYHARAHSFSHGGSNKATRPGALSCSVASCCQ